MKNNDVYCLESGEIVDERGKSLVDDPQNDLYLNANGKITYCDGRVCNSEGYSLRKIQPKRNFDLVKRKEKKSMKRALLFAAFLIGLPFVPSGYRTMVEFSDRIYRSIYGFRPSYYSQESINKNAQSPELNKNITLDSLVSEK